MNHDPVLVTGGAGFIGSHLVDHLLKEGHRVIVLDDFNDYYDPGIKRRNIRDHLSHDQYQLVEGDICQLDLVERLFKDYSFQMVVHLAARAGVRPSIQDPNLYERVNGIGTLNLLDSSRKFGCPNFIFASSSSVYGTLSKVPFSEEDPITRPISPYAATKRSNELMCYTYHHLYGMNITCLRFFTVYGPRQRPEMAIHKFTRIIHKGKPVPVYGDGSSRRDYTFIDDILQGLIAAMERVHPFEIINLGESETTSLHDLISMIEKALKVRATLEYHPVQPGDVPITYADISRARTMLDYQPTTPIHEGIQRFVDWFLITEGGTQ